jgi:GNAT superfamily N-acetyltransferase
MNSAPVVRTAIQEDIPSLLNLGRMLHEENAISDWSEDCIRAAVNKAVAGDRSLMAVIGPVGRPVAMIHLFIGNFWYSRNPHLEELYTYVHPAHRRSNYAKMLIEFAKRAADQLKMPLLIGVVSNHRTDAKIALYKRRLGPISGAYWLYNGKTGT